MCTKRAWTCPAQPNLVTENPSSCTPLLHTDTLPLCCNHKAEQSSPVTASLLRRKPGYACSPCGNARELHRLSISRRRRHGSVFTSARCLNKHTRLRSRLAEDSRRKARRSGTAAMRLPQCALLLLGVLLMVAGVLVALCAPMPSFSAPVLGFFLGIGGASLLVSVLCMAMKNLQAAVPGHFLLHPRTGTRFSPQQSLAIQRRLDRIRREMSTDSVSGGPDPGATLEPSPEPALPCTPPPWTMEPPPSYDTVMKIQEHGGDEQP
ncbi:uncharacterized protein si:dkeyp-51f12.3 [Syngnathus typhle]|uniref:uncharacterized protein si:dkeyp-51f12.3 n=1 Tax=Syngnathus typhle TaxID=161592 RepID=UPI002A6B6418|nr:uncharacterized protein si:dkeyp-51f12.3 [Syngnathus typhle]